MNVLICGAWDLLHTGHLNILERAKRLGGTLIVGVSTDELVSKQKKRRPIIPYEYRKRLVGALKCVDKTIPHRNAGEVQIFEDQDIDILVVDSKWGKRPGNEKRRKYIQQTRRKLVIFPYTTGISTTNLLEKIQEKNEHLSKGSQIKCIKF